VLDTIRRQTTLVRGAMEGTMLRNDIFNFARMGTHLERADNTARILDVKYHVLLPSLAWVGSRLDNAQWEMVLRSVAGERAFRWLNAGALEPKGIAEFLILDGRFPRSLAFCYNKLASNMAGWPMAMAETAAFADAARGLPQAACHRHRPDLRVRPARIHHRFHQHQPPDRRRHRRRLPFRGVGSQPMRIAISTDPLSLRPAGAARGAAPAAAPRACAVQTVLDWTLSIEGGAIECEYDDHNQNHTTLISLGTGNGGS
jgi:hypothetical protein